MEKIKLTLNDVMHLEAELNGVINSKTTEVVFKGLLSEKMNLKTKYWLTKLADKLSSEKKTIDALQEELIKKHGKELDNGMIQVQQWEDEEETILTEAYKEFIDQMNSLYMEEKEFDYNPIPLEELNNISAEGRFNLIFKLIKEEE